MVCHSLICVDFEVLREIGNFTALDRTYKKSIASDLKNGIE